MTKLVKVLLLVESLVFMIGCSTSTIIVNDKTNLKEYSKVDWAITKSDSIIDFRKSIDGYARVKDNIIIFSPKDDSVKKYNVNEFKTVHAKTEANLTTYIIGGIVGSVAILIFLFGSINVGG